MRFWSSSFVLGTHSQSLLEDFEHHYLSSLHSSTKEDSLPAYSHESTIVFICDLLDFLEARSTHGAHSFALFDPMPSLYSYNITSTNPLYVNEDGDIIHSLGQLFHLYGTHFITIGSKFKSSNHLGDAYKSEDLLVLPSHYWISVVLHGPSFHLAVVYVFYPSEQISLLPKKNIPPYINI